MNNKLLFNEQQVIYIHLVSIEYYLKTYTYVIMCFSLTEQKTHVEKEEFR